MARAFRIRHLFCAAAAVTGFVAAAAARAPEPLFVPVFRTDFPDPFVLEHEGEYLAYATNRDRGRTNVQVASSRDLVNWESLRDPQKPGEHHDAMPELPVWAKRGYTWAPEVMEIGGRYILYFTARDRKSDLQCVGAAIAASPRGPFRDSGTAPLVCQTELGGTIDASPFRDSDGQLYFYYKNDGNNPRAAKPTEIWGQRLSPDGTRLIGERVSLLRNDKPWEAHVVESPTMVKTPAGYTMLFSANDFGWQDHHRLSPYAVGYATCRSPLGPCTDAPENPILNSYNDPKLGCISGPGHQTVLRAKQRSYIVFHAWQTTPGCRRLDWKRFMYVAPLGWNAAGKPLIAKSLRPAE